MSLPQLLNAIDLVLSSASLMENIMNRFMVALWARRFLPFWLTSLWMTWK